MKIERVEIRKLALPMVHSFETSFEKLTHKETVITKVYADGGIVGYGESSSSSAPFYNHETVDTCFYMQEKFLAPAVAGKEFETAEAFRAAYANVVGNKIAKAGIECAFWHLIAQKESKSLKELFGGTRSEIPVGESIGIKPTIEATLAEIEERLAQGYVRIKVKIKPGWDVNVLEAIREKWPSVDLMADANSAYALDDILLLKTLDTFNLTMIEQPLGEDDIVDHAALARQLRTPICLDESIKGTADARKAVELGACKIINIKPGRVGGICESIVIHDFCKKKGIGVWCGGLLETGIGRAFNIALASKENFTYPADMSPFQFFYREDIIEPSYVVKPNGHIDVPTIPGLGYAIRESKVEEFTVQKAVIK